MVENEQSLKTIKGQKESFLSHNYIVLGEDELHKVSAADHLTIIGHSTAPKTEADTETAGLYIQGDNANQCVARLKRHGLQYAPKLLSLECCHAAIAHGIAEQLSNHLFFKYSLIEASTAAVGRNPGMGGWSLRDDSYGRALLGHNKLWIFYINGHSVAQREHDSYVIDDILKQISPQQFHVTFFSHYQPGCLGGRVGRYCLANKSKISLEQALFFAKEKTVSATQEALDLTLDELYQPLSIK
jgi:hypothetical protein